MDRKIIVVSRVFNEREFIGYFLNYYLSHDVDKIILFDSGSNDGTLDMILQFMEKSKKIELVITGRCFNNYKEEVDYNKYIWNYLMSNITYPDFVETVYILVDVDEFLFAYTPLKGIINFDFFLKNYDKQEIFNICRTIFIERFPKIDGYILSENIFGRDFSWNVSEHFPYGKLQDLWGDIIYKHNIVLVNDKNLLFTKSIEPSAGFHRWVFEKKLILENSPVLYVNHVRAISWKYAFSRIERKLKSLTTINDWKFVHYRDLLKSLKNIYETLKSGKIPEILTSTKDNNAFYKNIYSKFRSYKPDKSFFNNVIMQQNINDPEPSTPEKLKNIT